MGKLAIEILQVRYCNFKILNSSVHFLDENSSNSCDKIFGVYHV